MGKYGFQRGWGQKDSAKDGGNKTDNVRGAQNNKTERLRGAGAKSGDSDAAACRTELNAYSQAAGLGVGATTWMELGESRAAEEVSRSMGVQGMARGQASPKGSQRTPRTGPEGSSPLYRGTATAEEGPGRSGRV